MKILKKDNEELIDEIKHCLIEDSKDASTVRTYLESESTAFGKFILNPENQFSGRIKELIMSVSMQYDQLEFCTLDSGFVSIHSLVDRTIPALECRKEVANSIALMMERRFWEKAIVSIFSRHCDTFVTAGKKDGIFDQLRTAIERIVKPASPISTASTTTTTTSNNNISPTPTDIPAATENKRYTSMAIAIRQLISSDILARAVYNYYINLQLLTGFYYPE